MFGRNRKINFSPRRSDSPKYKDYFPELSAKPTLSPLDVAEWFTFRAAQIEERTGLLENGLVLLNWAIDKFVPADLISEKIEHLQISMEELKDFVYIWGIDKSVSLLGFKEMENTAKLAIYVSRLEQLRVESGTDDKLSQKFLILSREKNSENKLEKIIMWLQLGVF